MLLRTLTIKEYEKSKRINVVDRPLTRAQKSSRQVSDIFSRRRSRRSTIFILYYFGRFAEKFLLVIVLFIGDSFLH